MADHPMDHENGIYTRWVTDTTFQVITPNAVINIRPGRDYTDLPGKADDIEIIADDGAKFWYANNGKNGIEYTREKKSEISIVATKEEES